MPSPVWQHALWWASRQEHIPKEAERPGHWAEDHRTLLEVCAQTPEDIFSRAHYLT